MFEWLFNPAEHPSAFWAMIGYFIFMIITYLLFTKFNSKKLLRNSLVKQKNLLQASNPEAGKSHGVSSNRVYYSQADKDIDQSQRKEFEEFGPLITVISSRKTKYFIGGLVVLVLNALAAFNYGRELHKLSALEGSAPVFYTLLISVMILVFIYVGLNYLHNSTYSIRLYRKGLMVRSFIKVSGYYYDSIKEMKFIDNTAEEAGKRRSIFNPEWICELHMNDNKTLIVNSRLYSSDIADKFTRLRKILDLEKSIDPS